MYDERSPWKLSKDKQGFIEKVLDRFGRDIKCLDLFVSSSADKSC